ncbi:hypothetical protein [Nitratireductor thuwali]|uniref:Uncharacterized protein n=1 Tax=Nitratireductor thuwali TaxID=2267699 RepID=A0ABY5MGZ6_9HYPH|nr:hypothetical protein NTH_00986 [Nitratireductor thuwali]
MADSNEYVILSLKDSKPDNDELQPGGSGELHVTVVMQAEGGQDPSLEYQLWVVFPDGGGLDVEGSPAVDPTKGNLKVPAETSWSGGKGLRPYYTPNWNDRSTALLAHWTPESAGVTDASMNNYVGWIIKYKAKAADKYDFLKQPLQRILLYLRVAGSGALIYDASIDKHKTVAVTAPAPAFVPDSLSVDKAHVATTDKKLWIGPRPQIVLHGQVTPVTAAKTMSVQWKIGSGSWSKADNVPVSNGRDIGPWTISDAAFQQEGEHKLELQVAADSKSSWSKSLPLTVNVDATAPALSDLVIEVTAKGEAHLTGKISDAGSGVASWEGTWPAGSGWKAKDNTSGSVDAILGKKLDFSTDLSLRATDNVGNTSAPVPVAIAADTLLEIAWNLPKDQDLNLGEAFLYIIGIGPKLPATLPPLDVELELPPGAGANGAKNPQSAIDASTQDDIQWVTSDPSWTGAAPHVHLIRLPAFKEAAVVQAAANVSPQTVELVGNPLPAATVVVKSQHFKKAISLVQPKPRPSIYAAPPRFAITSPDARGWVTNSKAVSFSGVFRPPLDDRERSAVRV